MRTWRMLAAAGWLAVMATGAGAAEPPEAKIVPFTETLHGETISDPYRWMEGSDPDYVPWLKAQEAHARAWLAALPKRAELLKGIEARSGALASLGEVQATGGRLFLMRRPASAQRGSLYVREGGGTERLLFDPTSFDKDGAEGHAINYWEASPDGKHIYLGVSPGGSELATLRVIEVASGRMLDEAIPMALFNGASGDLGGWQPQWLPDGSGFVYNRLAEKVKPGDADFFLNSRLFLHKVGSDPARDVLIAEAGKASKVGLGPTEAPDGTMQPGSPVMLLSATDGVARAMTLMSAPIAAAASGEADWTKVAGPADKVEGFALLGDDLFLLRRDKPRGRVLKTKASAPSLANAVEVVPEGSTVINGMIAAKDGLYLIERAAAGTRIRRLGRDGGIVTARLPYDGTSYSQFGTPAADGLYASLETYVTPRGRYFVRGEAVADTGLSPKPPFSTDAYVTEAVLVEARDGAKVPLDITRRKDTPKDGRRPVLLEAYGAYGYDVDPYFNPRLYALLDAGAVYAVAHVRGGGEYGADWWQAGHKATKPNTWRDAIDSAEWLVKEGWTGPRKITLWGTSAGGIMAGRGVTERPDLWAGVVASVGAMNALRFEFTPNGETNIAEFGTVKTPEGYRALKAMDGYQAIEDGKAYPPMLLTAGMNDQRVITWQPAKFAARMQAATTGGPVIFKVDTEQGHGIGSGRTQLDNDAADIAAFTLWAAERE